MIRAALIDMDGTLYDSMPGHCIAWERLCREQGWHFTPGEFFHHEGRTGRATIAMLEERTSGRRLTLDECDRLYAFKQQYFNELGPARIMPGAQAMVQALLDHGILTILVTGSAQRTILDRLQRDFPGAFPAHRRVTALDVTHGKPHPEPYLKGAQLAGVTPSECLVVENAPIGVEAGHASGAYTVAVTTGPIPAADMLRAGADTVYPTMQALADDIPTLLDRLRS